MTIKIISKKIVKSLYPRIALINYTNELSDNAKTFDGFIKSNSYWKFKFNEFKDESIIISISEWKDYKSWNNWYNSKTRNEIYQENKKIIKSEEFSYLIKKIQNDDLFLL